MKKSTRFFAVMLMARCAFLRFPLLSPVVDTATAFVGRMSPRCTGVSMLAAAHQETIICMSLREQSMKALTAHSYGPTGLNLMVIMLRISPLPPVLPAP